MDKYKFVEQILSKDGARVLIEELFENISLILTNPKLLDLLTRDMMGL